MVFGRRFLLEAAACFALARTVWKRVLDPVLGGVLACSVGAAFLVGFFLENAEERRLGLLAAAGFAELLVIFIGSVEIPRDIVSRNAHFYLSKPLGRGGYLAGKFLGILLLGVLLVGVEMAALAAEGMAGGVGVQREFIITAFQLALQVLALSALVILVSVALSETAATIFGIAFYLAGYLIFILPPIGRCFLPGWAAPVTLAAYHVLPNWQFYTWRTESMGGWVFLGWLAGYTVAYVAAALPAAYFLFSRRDLG